MYQVKRLKLTKNVIFTGKVPIEEIQIYYQLMDVFTTFSVTETQGLTVIEAMASSLPVLAIKDDSFVDSVINGKNGYLFDTDEEFRNNLYKIYDSKELYRELSNNASLLSKKHSMEEFGNRVFDVYLDTIKEYNDKKLNINNIKEVIKNTKNSDKKTKND